VPGEGCYRRVIIGPEHGDLHYTRLVTFDTLGSAQAAPRAARRAVSHLFRPWLIGRLLVNHSPLFGCDNLLYGLSRARPPGVPSRPTCGQGIATRKRGITESEENSEDRNVPVEGSNGLAYSGGGCLPLPAGGIPAVAGAPPGLASALPQAVGSQSDAAEWSRLRELDRRSSTRRHSFAGTEITVKGAPKARRYAMAQERHPSHRSCPANFSAYQEDGSKLGHMVNVQREHDPV